MSTKACNELLNLILHDTTPFTPTFFPELITSDYFPATATHPPENLVAEGGGVKKKKRRKRGTRVCKNKRESETQRMTHIAVERNRRKQMNEHLAVLRSLLPESHLQRGDQASIVGGAIDFVKELEHLLQSLEAQKFRLTQQQQQQQQQQQDPIIHDQNSNFTTNSLTECEVPQLPLYFHKLFSYPQYTWSQVPNNGTSISKTSMADIEVSLVQTHANLRILMRKRLFHLSKMVLFLQTCYLSILHLNVTTLDSFVLYSISLKVEEGCLLNSADDIAGAVHQMMLGLIEEESWIHPNLIEQ